MKTAEPKMCVNVENSEQVIMKSKKKYSGSMFCKLTKWTNDFRYEIQLLCFEKNKNKKLTSSRGTVGKLTVA